MGSSETHDVHSRKPMTFVPGYKHDIFVSYASVDDQPLHGAKEGWVTTLVKNLKILLGQKLGSADAYSLWVDSKLAGNIQMTPEIMNILRNTATFIVILSPGYLASDWCKKQTNSFLSVVKDHIRAGSRVFVIERDRLEAEERPPEFGGVVGYQFWVEDREGKPPRVLGEPKLQPDDLQYYEKLTDLSYDLVKELRKLKVYADSANKDSSPKSTILTTVFLADVTDDLLSKRDDVKRYLIQANLRVLPETYYSLEPNAFQNAVQMDLTKSDLFVQLLSAVPGRKPPGLPQGYGRCQYELAHKMGKPVLQWRDPGLNINEVQDLDHRDFLQLSTVRGDIGIEGLKSEIVKKLTEQKKAPPDIGGTKGKLVFIDADVNDSLLRDKICQLLDEEEQIEYVEFVPGQQKTSVHEAFEDWLLECNAFVVMYGQVDFSWLNQVFRNVRKIVWKRAQQPVAIYVVCDPSPEQKQLLRMKIRGLKMLEYGSCSDEQKLREFLNSL